MDDTAQKQVQANDNNQAQPAVRTPLDNVQQPPVVNPQQPVPTGSLHKEAELAPVSDFVKPTEMPAVKDKEVAEAGVQEVSSAPELTREHEQIGVKPSAEVTPVKIVDSSEEDNLPMTKVQATQVVKKSKNIRSSIVWLAILMLKHFKRMHRKLWKKGT
jgi:hypothetical protein